MEVSLNFVFLSFFFLAAVVK